MKQQAALPGMNLPEQTPPAPLAAEDTREQQAAPASATGKTRPHDHEQPREKPASPPAAESPEESGEWPPTAEILQSLFVFANSIK